MARKLLILASREPIPDRLLVIRKIFATAQHPEPLTILDLPARNELFGFSKVARTIADLETADGIAPPHIAEAVRYRKID